MDLAAFVRDMMAAAPPEEPVAQEPLSPVRWSPAALQRARVIMAARRQTVHVGNPHWRKRPAKRRADLEDHSSGYDAWEPPPDAQQDTHQDTQQERNEKADANWSRTLAQRQSLHVTARCVSRRTALHELFAA